MNNDCLFCKIIEGQIPSHKVYEDDKCYAFLDIFPVNYGHTLIVPKEHVVTLYDISDESLAHIFKVAKKLGPIVSEALDCDGITFNQNNGHYQDVKHFHLHLMPRYAHDSQMIRNNRPNDDKYHLQALAKIRNKLKKDS